MSHRNKSSRNTPFFWVVEEEERKAEEKGRVLSVPISCGNNDICVLWNETGLSNGDETVGGDDGTRRRIHCDCGDCVFDDDIDYDYYCCYYLTLGWTDGIIYDIYMVCT